MSQKKTKQLLKIKIKNLNYELQVIQKQENKLPGQSTIENKESKKIQYQENKVPKQGSNAQNQESKSNLSQDIKKKENNVPEQGESKKKPYISDKSMFQFITRVTKIPRNSAVFAVISIFSTYLYFTVQKPSQEKENLITLQNVKTKENKEENQEKNQVENKTENKVESPPTPQPSKTSTLECIQQFYFDTSEYKMMRYNQIYRQPTQPTSTPIISPSSPTLTPPISPKHQPPIINGNKQSPNMPKQLKYFLNEFIVNNRGKDEGCEYYIRQRVSKQEFMKHYSIKNLAQQNLLGEHCNAMIPVRRDVNCFYTAFGYQLLKIAINDQQFYEDLKRYQEIDFVIKKGDQQLIDKNTGKGLLNHFFKILEYFLSIENQIERNNIFDLHFAAYEENEVCDGFFYTLTVIFLRNLSYKFIMESNKYRDLVFDKENLLLWEAKCSKDEFVIILLAEKLRIKIKWIFFDYIGYYLNTYGEKHQNTIILLKRSGHYNIGLQQISE